MSDVILSTFDFDNDHLYMFSLSRDRHDSERYFHPKVKDKKNAAEVSLNELNLKVRNKFLFLYDFGDEWLFDITVKKIRQSDILSLTYVKEQVGVIGQEAIKQKIQKGEEFMANTIKNNGNCYLCGKEFGKTAMKNHLVKEHYGSEGTEINCLLRIEDKYDKNYWLYLDVLEKSTLNSLDKFLRKIWLECCGHLSEFTHADRENVGKNTKTGMILGPNDKLNYEYDFGSSTDLVITCVGRHYVPSRKNGIELVARNVPTKYICSECGEEAVVFAPGYCNDLEDDKFYCEECYDKLEDGESVFFSVTNSPRMGVCGYEGELDVYEFDVDKLKKK